jgi:hypothetical protein
MKDIDVKIPIIRNPMSKVKIDTDSISRMVYNDDSFDFIDTGDE